MTLLLLAVAVAVVAGAYALTQDHIESRNLKAALWEHYELERRLGAGKARELCAHRYVTFGQTGVPGVVTMTSKWCRVCGSHLGPAKLKDSLFGGTWV